LPLLGLLLFVYVLPTPLSFFPCPGSCAGVTPIPSIIKWFFRETDFTQPSSTYFYSRRRKKKKAKDRSQSGLGNCEGNYQRGGDSPGLASVGSEFFWATITTTTTTAVIKTTTVAEKHEIKHRENI
jgi:hypothetical protein